MTHEVTITVSGAVGSGKSAICGEIEILCKALGLQVEWVGAQQEKNLTHADWTEALEMYKPSVTIIEHPVSRPGGDESAKPYCVNCGTYPAPDTWCNCSVGRAIRDSEAAVVASKEAVTLSDEVLDAAIAAYDKAWCDADRGWANKAGAIESAFNAIILAQRDASKAEGQS